jgi:hypothetical protein
MKATQKKPAVDLRMSSAEFDRIMAQALQVKPDNVKKSKRRPKAKSARKKAAAKEV